MNLLLKWDHSSDLDIQVRCGCNKWFGPGTENPETKCGECEMNREENIEKGPDGSTINRIVRVVFGNPGKLFGKEIGMACYNKKQGDPDSGNKFKMAFLNRHGY